MYETKEYSARYEKNRYTFFIKRTQIKHKYFLYFVHSKRKGVLTMYEENENKENMNTENINQETDANRQPVADTTYRNVYYRDDVETGRRTDYYSGDYYSGNSSTQESSREKKKRGKKAVKMLKFAAKAAAFGVIAGAAFYGINAAANYIYPANQSVQNTVQLPATVVSGTAAGSSDAAVVMDVSDVVEAVMPSVVSVVGRFSSEITYGPFSLGKQEYDGSGSGIIVGQSDKELLIATNNHVVEDAETLAVTFTDNTPQDMSDDVTVEAVVKGTRSDNDLAVIAVPIENIPEEVLAYIKIATLGDSDNLRAGEGTIAIGNALGYGQSVTTGCVSALNRLVQIDNLSLNMIQTDAAINQGNSGGALLNMRGEVIGINSAKYSSTGVEGMGYAIPISSVVDIINELMNRETRTIVDEKDRGYLGVKGIEISADYSQAYGVPVGFSVQEVVEGGAAEKAGIQKYDIIVRVDGQTVESYDDLSGLLQYYKAGETVSVVVKYIENHEYVEREVELTLQKAE